MKYFEAEIELPVLAKGRVGGANDALILKKQRLICRVPQPQEPSHPTVIKFKSGVPGQKYMLYKQCSETGQLFYPTEVLAGSGLRMDFDNCLNLDRGADLAGMGDMYRGVFDIYSKAREAGDVVWPQLTDDVMAEGRFSHRISSYLHKDVAIKQYADLEGNHRRYQQILDQYIIAKNRIWTPCDEPMIMVRRGRSHWGMTLSHDIKLTQDWAVFAFSLAEIDYAREWIDVLNAEFKHREIREIELDVAPGVNSPTNIIGKTAKAIAQAAIENLSLGGQKLQDQHPEVIGIYAQIKTFLAKPIEEITTDEAEQQLYRIRRICDIDEDGGVNYIIDRRLDCKLNGIRAIDPKEFKKFKAVVDLHIRRIQERPVEMVAKQAKSVTP